MEVKNLVNNKYVPLIDTYYNHDTKLPKPSDSSLLSTTPEEIQRNLMMWRKEQERIHIVV
jgi:hypothetical protein